MGVHSKVCALLAGVFHQRPAQLTYIFTCDMEIVFQYIRAHWYENSSLNDAEIRQIHVSASFTKLEKKSGS